jgi:hypothetical protein
MKRLTFLSIFCVMLLTSCAPTKYATTDFTEPIVKTYDISGTKDELFLKSNLWMVSAFKDPKSVIQYSDKTEGIITGKYLLHYYKYSYTGGEELMYAIIEIRAKDGRVRISVNPDNWKYMVSDIYARPVAGSDWNYTKEMAVADIEALCESFHKSLQAEGVKF